MARILVVDDSMLIRQIVKKALKTEGHEVIEASDGVEALEKAVAEKPECIFLDILMPEMDGFGVLEKLKEKGLSIPVIVLSADIQETTKTKCFELGVADFLNKVPKEDEMLGALQKVLSSNKNEELCSPQTNR
ncbi:MAG: response regulator [Halobacteriota archaeon]|nr:response regulator [Halobacteriota archaeon]